MTGELGDSHRHPTPRAVLPAGLGRPEDPLLAGLSCQGGRLLHQPQTGGPAGVNTHTGCRRVQVTEPRSNTCGHFPAGRHETGYTTTANSFSTCNGGAESTDHPVQSAGLEAGVGCPRPCWALTLERCSRPSPHQPSARGFTAVIPLELRSPRQERRGRVCPLRNYAGSRIKPRSFGGKCHPQDLNRALPGPQFPTRFPLDALPWLLEMYVYNY